MRLSIGMASIHSLNRPNTGIILKTTRSPLKSQAFKEAFENINRTKPVRLNVAGSNQPSKEKKPEPIKPLYLSVPTEAEMDFYQSGLRLPNTVENLEKLLVDLRKSGRFDNELCYLLRKKESLKELQDWITTVWKKRCDGDDEFGREADPTRFNEIMESSLRKCRDSKLFQSAFISSLVNG